MPYYYISHMGGYYDSEECYDYGWLYCEICRDSDMNCGWFDDDEEFFKAYPEQDPNFDWEAFYNEEDEKDKDWSKSK